MSISQKALYRLFSRRLFSCGKGPLLKYIILQRIDRLPNFFLYFFLKIYLKISLNPKFQNFRVTDFKFSPEITTKAF
jgi:hypothetical protein